MIKYFKRKIRDFKTGICNLISYTSLLFKDRDYDYEFFLVLLKKKLERMKWEFENCIFVEDQDKMAAQVSECVVLIDKILADEYFEELEKNNKQENRRDLIFESVYLRQRDVNELFRIISYNVLSWWT